MTTWWTILLSVVLFGALAFSVVLLMRPWYHNWGATGEEATQALPGDDLVPKPTGAATRAVTIHAPASAVWPWLVQVGYKRAGWYNYDWLNRLMGAGDFVDGHRSARRIVPQLQNLKVG